MNQCGLLSDVGTFVDELGIGLDQTNELFAVHLQLARLLLGVAGNQLHDVVVVDDATGLLAYLA